MLSIMPAGPDDAGAISQLVNKAYRGPESRAGWTTEADLIDGNLRINDQSLMEMFTFPDAVILKVMDDEQLAGCVYLEKQKDKLYLGMLAVDPRKQDKGIGKSLLKAAEEKAKNMQCRAIIMTVISARTELIRWYEKHGYAHTGIVKPFPSDNRFGVPKKPLEFIVLEKKLAD